ncbi:histidine phosphatase family protein [Oceanivirga miroungae]|uniref:Phosphoglycerate mutase n=1 Tax=Oceanivirga miroungae TaxID=1130046 RepID=A0A6I8MAJ6_9FUSO|nr:histidine phosphatase family protein [Oceanivirga miroungae]VWL85802.1 phosphoglycerate mutase [Oceanivirga miroungae]
MLVYLVRHGKTKWNLENRIQGHADSELLEDDNSHILAANKLKGIEFAHICSSDLKRAYVTKNRILDILKIDSIDYRYEEFREVGFGELEGSKLDYVLKNYPDVWAKYKTLDHNFDPGIYIKGFESVKNVYNRAYNKIQELKKIYGDDSKILIVSHGSLISILSNHNKKVDYAKIPDNGSVTILEF